MHVEVQTYISLCLETVRDVPWLVVTADPIAPSTYAVLAALVLLSFALWVVTESVVVPGNVGFVGILTVHDPAPVMGDAPVMVI